MSANRHWSKFWWQDWMRDPALRSCSVAARGLWMDMLAIAHDGDPYGHVTINGQAASVKRIGTIAGITERQATALIAELEEAGVFSRTPEKIIYSRRMLRDKAASESGRDAISKRWGDGQKPKTTPTRVRRHDPNRGADSLEAESESEAEAESTRRTNAARDPIPLMPARSDPPHKWEHLGDATEVDEDGKRHPVVGGYYLDVVANLVCEAAGIDNAHWRGDWRPVAEWLRSKLPPDTVILPAIRAVASRPGYDPRSIRSLAYFDAAVREGQGGGQSRARQA